MFWFKKELSGLKEKLDKAKDEIDGLEKQSVFLRRILESMAEGVIALDKDTRIISINPSAEKIFGIDKKESEGSFLLEAIRNNDISELVNEVLSKGEFISKELVINWPISKVFQVNACAISENGIVWQCLLVIHDITQIRMLEVMRRDFVANVSHELKTPLTSIKGFVETLIDGALEDKEHAKDFLKIIQAHAERLDSLVNDLLALSYLESKEVTLAKEGLDFKVLADSVLSEFTSQLNKKSARIENNLPLNLFLKVDKDKMGQVLTNLIDNAIKFSKEGGLIKIYSQDAGARSKIVIEDFGIGIPQKDIPRIFERFYRVDKARSRQLGGTGLGLSIVKHIVELHGGSVGVESIEGSGSKFWFILPV